MTMLDYRSFWVRPTLLWKACCGLMASETIVPRTVPVLLHIYCCSCPFDPFLLARLRRVYWPFIFRSQSPGAALTPFNDGCRDNEQGVASLIGYTFTMNALWIALRDLRSAGGRRRRNCLNCFGAFANASAATHHRHTFIIMVLRRHYGWRTPGEGVDPAPPLPPLPQRVGCD